MLHFIKIEITPLQYKFKLLIKNHVLLKQEQFT